MHLGVTSMMSSSLVKEDDKSLPNQINESAIDQRKLISYLEKVRVRDDMRRILISRVIQLRTLIEIDYAELRKQMKIMVKDKGLDESILSLVNIDDKQLTKICELVQLLDGIYIKIKSCDLDYPNLGLLSEICHSYIKFCTIIRPDLIRGFILRSQDKFGVCNGIIHLCDVYSNNTIWIEYQKGTMII